MKKHSAGSGKTGIITAVLFLLISLFTSASAETRLMVVSDLHYLAPELYRDSSLFLQILRNGDGKVTQHGDTLLEALYRQIQSEQPDALIVTGDLTFNGEKLSHAALAEWFGTVEDAGVPVWVIPGNHDINTVRPVGFGNGLYYTVESVTPEEFAAIYAGFLEPGEAGFSYTAKISDDLRVAMTDVSWYSNQAETFDLFTPAHAAWLEAVLRDADAAGAKVVTATHHSLLPHTDFARDSFLMFGSESMLKLAAEYGVKLNLSGHLHIQHIARSEDMADAALGAFCIWPHRYALVTCRGDGKLQYEAKALDEAFLPEEFLQDSRDWFAGITRDKLTDALSGTPEEISLMADYAARFNLAYFSGTYRQDDTSWMADPACVLWQKQQDSGFWQHMQLVKNESAGDNLHWEE